MALSVSGALHNVFVYTHGTPLSDHNKRNKPLRLCLIMFCISTQMFHQKGLKMYIWFLHKASFVIFIFFLRCLKSSSVLDFLWFFFFFNRWFETKTKSLYCLYVDSTRATSKQTDKQAKQKQNKKKHKKNQNKDIGNKTWLWGVILIQLGNSATLIFSALHELLPSFCRHWVLLP